MTTYTWDIVTIDYDIVDGQNVPTVMHWTCSGEDAEGNTGYSYGTQSVTAAQRSGVDWDSITKDEAINWLMAELSATTRDVNEEGVSSESQKQQIENGIGAQIAEKANPTHGTGLPWQEPKTGTMDITE
jgi:hypothetical protein